MEDAVRRAGALIGVAAALVLGPAARERRLRAPLPGCAAPSAACAWLEGRRPALERATLRDLIHVPGLGPDAARGVARRLTGRRLEGWAEVEACVGPKTRRLLEPFFSVEDAASRGAARSRCGVPNR